jgi:signal peptidase II
LRVIYVSIGIVFVDQLTKLLVKGFSIPFLNFRYEGMYHGQRIPVIDDFFRLTFIENPGMAFGYDPGNEWKMWISIFSLVASIGLIVYLFFIRNQSLSLRLAIAFIIGGAVGNMIDRIFYGIFYGYAPLFYGKVVDFLDFDFFNITILDRNYDRWPIFNIADAAVTIGVLILLIFYGKHHKESEEEKTEIQSSPEAEAEFVSSNPGTHHNNSQASDSNAGEESELADKNKSDNVETDKGKEIPD